MTDLAAEYRRQFEWRDWPSLLAELPPLHGQTILDLGCGPGDLAAELSARGGCVRGYDINEQLLAYARSRAIPNAEFLFSDLRTGADLGAPADGIWVSFAAAYFLDLPAALTRWSQSLKPGGWIALTEIDDLFGHHPLSPDTCARLEAYCADALAAGRYDFFSGRKLAAHLESAGFRILTTRAHRDRELAFDGPAEPAVREAWRRRLDRMKLLHDFLGPRYTAIRDEFLACLEREDHHSAARVVFCLATRAGR